MGIKCIGSLVKNCVDPISLVIHDDGTLDNADINTINEQLAPNCLIRRREADERVAERLSRYPSCQAFRNAHILALKLFDVPLLSKDPVVYCDTDIIFLRKFSGLDRRSVGKERFVYMMDSESTYSISNFHRWIGPNRVRMPERVNSGLYFCDVGTLDLELAEWFLSEPRYGPEKWHAEQTCWALHAERKGGRCWNPTQITPPTETPTALTIAVHCSGWHKYLIDQLDAAEWPADNLAAEMQTIPPVYDSFLSVARHRITNRINGYLGRAKRYARSLATAAD
jgi:hypothetical protein